MVAPAGAGPWPQITWVEPRLTSCMMMGTSPPGPFRCGSTTCSVKAVATPASKALPPFSSVAIPTAVAIQWVEVTTPKVPSISGRVVNGSGLMLLAMGLAPSCFAQDPSGQARGHAFRKTATHLSGSSARRAQLITARPSCQLACQRLDCPLDHPLGRPLIRGSGGGRCLVNGVAGDALDQGGRLLPA